MAAEVPTWNLHRLDVGSAAGFDPEVWRLQVNALTRDAAGNDVIAFTATHSGPTSYALSWHKPAWEVSQLKSVNSILPGRYFVVGGFTCGTNGFDRISGTMHGTPVTEDLLFAHDRGAIAAIGPTRGTWVKGNSVFGAAYLKELYRGSGNSYGSAFTTAQRATLIVYPGLTDAIRSYVFLGDPLVGGPETITGVETVPVQGRTRLANPAPNPSNPTVSIRYFLAAAAEVRLVVYDIHGRRVRRLLHRSEAFGGWKHLTWDGRSDTGTPVASGVYFIRLDAGDTTDSKRLVVVR
jgi:hypothetical protein